MSTIKCPYSQKDYILQQNIRLYWTFYVKIIVNLW